MENFFEGMAEIFEIEASEITSDLVLREYGWDSLALISTIALIDECFGVILNGQDLFACLTIADIQTLVKNQK